MRVLEVKVLATGSTGNCYRVTDGVTPLLLEAGIPIKKIKEGLNFKLSEIKGCLISHRHMDHFKAAKDIVKAGIDIFASVGTIGDLKSHRMKPIEALKQFSIGTWTILPFDTEHDCVEPLGFLLQSSVTGNKLLFATDTYYLKYKFTGLTHIMIECNYSSEILNENIENGSVCSSQKGRIIRSHFSLENLKFFLESNDLSKVEEIMLIHLSSRNGDGEYFKREIQRVTGKVVIVA